MEIFLLAFAALWFLGSVILVPIVASQKRREALEWVLVSLLCSPLLTLIALSAISDRPAKEKPREPEPPGP